MKMVFAGAALALLLPGAARATCAPPQNPLTHISVPGHPFSAIPARDGCTIFVSLPGNGQSHIAVVSRNAGTPLREIAAEGDVTGMSLSPDGRFLAAATGSGVAIFDAARLADGAADALLTASDDDVHAGSIYTAFTPDGHYLFAANERSASLSVYDASGLPQSLKRIGRIAVGRAPVGLAFSPDGKYLYSTSQVGPENWPGRCTSEGPRHPEGLLALIDVAKAASDPAHAVLAGVAAGCNPVRVALAPGGATLYVTARGEDLLQAFDAQKLLTDGTHAALAKVRVGSAPVGVIAAKGKIIVTNSDRFGGGDHQTLTVLDAANLTAPQASIPAGGFPRELSVTADGMLLATNFNSRDVELIDLARLDAAAK